ncbi:MAG: hypothetical protein EP347_01355 [Alphaproteobacteria bacterium]|nr:MAG: hypothetical protein EP347_01355 [Alphaproteobacteria bacterium]
MSRLTGPVSAAVLFMLFIFVHVVKLDAKGAREENYRLEAEIQREQQAIQILSAEWSHLNQPAKLEQMAVRYLALKEVRTTQIVALEDVPYMGLDLFDQHGVSGPVMDAAHETPRYQQPGSDYYVQIQAKE